MGRSLARGERERRGGWPDPGGNLAGSGRDGSRTIRGRFEGVGAAETRSDQAGDLGEGAEPGEGRARAEGRGPDPGGKVAGTWREGGRNLAGSWPEPGGTVRGRFENDSRTVRGRRGGGNAVRPGRRPRRWRGARRGASASGGEGDRNLARSWPDPGENLAGRFGDDSRTIRERFENDSRTSGRRKNALGVPFPRRPLFRSMGCFCPIFLRA